MPRTGRVRRFFPEVQRIITEFFKLGVDPTIHQIQQALYNADFNPDSKQQRDIVYGCIMCGRENVIKMWDAYVSDPQFVKDIQYAMTYRSEEVEKQRGSKEFREFNTELEDGKFGKDSDEIKESLEYYLAVAIIFENKMLEYSKASNNFIIASGGQDSQWFIPSFWKWNIREFHLYTRSLKILRRQLLRGIRTKVLLPSGQPIEKALGYETVVRAALEDKTVWTCPSCSARNLDSSEFCRICGSDKPEEKSSGGK
jgi:ribosomal protein L40E